MIWKKIVNSLRNFWQRFNHGWDHAAEMQKRIDEAKLQHQKYHLFKGGL